MVKITCDLAKVRLYRRQLLYVKGSKKKSLTQFFYLLTIYKNGMTSLMSTIDFTKNADEIYRK